MLFLLVLKPVGYFQSSEAAVFCTSYFTHMNLRIYEPIYILIVHNAFGGSFPNFIIRLLPGELNRKRLTRFLSCSLGKLLPLRSCLLKHPLSHGCYCILCPTLYLPVCLGNFLSVSLRLRVTSWTLLQ